MQTMRTLRLVEVLGLMALLAPACGGDDDTADDGAGGGTSASTTAGASVSSNAGVTAASVSASTTNATASSSTGGTPVVCDDEEPAIGGYCGLIKPILEAKCAPCHSGSTPGNCSGGQCSVDFYEDTQKDSSVCVGKKVYECMLDRIANGSMPLNAGCTGNPSDDAENPACLSAADQIVFAAWVSDGAPLE